jgi:hypothetical protein
LLISIPADHVQGREREDFYIDLVKFLFSAESLRERKINVNGDGDTTAAASGNGKKSKKGAAANKRSTSTSNRRSSSRLSGRSSSSVGDDNVDMPTIVPLPGSSDSDILIPEFPRTEVGRFPVDLFVIYHSVIALGGYSDIVANEVHILPFNHALCGNADS